MIYEVNVSDLPSLVINSSSSLIIISADSLVALIRTQDVPHSFIQEYSESDLQELVRLDKWKQPCISCGEN